MIAVAVTVIVTGITYMVVLREWMQGVRVKCTNCEGFEWMER